MDLEAQSSVLRLTQFGGCYSSCVHHCLICVDDRCFSMLAECFRLVADFLEVFGIELRNGIRSRISIEHNRFMYEMIENFASFMTKKSNISNVFC